MRLGVQVSNNGPRARIVLDETEITHLTAGWPSEVRPRFIIEGDAIKGLRVAVSRTHGLLMQPASGKLWTFVSCRLLGIRPEGLPSQDVPARMERDDDGPILLTFRLPEDFVPRERLREWQRAAPPVDVRVEAEQLFRGAARLKNKHDTPWNLLREGGMHTAQVTCSRCGETANVNLAHNLPHDVIAKKFATMGWEVGDSRNTCPVCLAPVAASPPEPPPEVVHPEALQPEPLPHDPALAQPAPFPQAPASEPPPPPYATSATLFEAALAGGGMVELQTAVATMSAALARLQLPRIADLKAAVEMVNEQLVALNDASVQIRVVGGRLKLFRVTEI